MLGGVRQAAYYARTVKSVPIDIGRGISPAAQYLYHPVSGRNLLTTIDIVPMPLCAELKQAIGPSQSNRLSAAMRNWAKIWNMPELEATIAVDLNRRLSRSIARYRQDRYRIEVGSRFLSLRARREEVLCHEFAHAAIDRLYGRRARAHGAEWQRLVTIAGYKATVKFMDSGRLKTCPANARYTRSAIYEHRCLVCHMERRAKRPVQRWRCADCVSAGLSGELEITRIENS